MNVFPDTRQISSIIMVITGIIIILIGGWSPVYASEEHITDTSELNMTVSFDPVPVASRDGINIAYELELLTPDNTPILPERIDVLDAATEKILFTENSTLLASMFHPAAVPPPTQAEIQNGTPKLPMNRISIWFKVSPDAVPDILIHHISLNRTSEGRPPVTSTGGDVIVRKGLKPVIIGSPVKGPAWATIETTSPLTHHFRSQVTLDNETRVPQRYAQDFLYLDPETGEAVSGNDTIARDYLGFGKELYAVADGTVVETHDGMPDIEITTEKPPASVETATGNSVIIDIGDRKYACYAHMVNGSIQVKPGDMVTEGQVIGLMGNSGNSDAPHLHFQVITDSPKFLGAEGYPHVYRSFDLIGICDPDNENATFFEKPVHRENELMENNDIVSFP
jgi:murein DD-endopeptidase MepM/ murein hydrolase activator NlpD